MNESSKSNNINLDSIKSTVNQIAKQYEIIKWDLGAIYSNDLSVQVDQGQAKQLKGSQKSTLTIRVWNSSNLLGITTTSDLTTSGIKKAFKKAFEASNYANDNETVNFSSEANSPLPPKINSLSKSIGIYKLLEKLIKAEKQLIDSHEFIDSVPYNGLSEAKVERIYLNSDGSIRQMEITQASLYLYAKGQEVGKKPRSGGAVRIATGINDIDFNGCIQESSNKILSHMHYAPVPTSKYLVCFTPEAFLDLIGAFSNIFNARSILDGISLSTKESIGTNISVPFLSLSDEALHKDNIGVFTFDGEGTPKKNIQLIKNGVLINLLHSEATARQFNVKPTGHGSLGAKASVIPDWFVINKTNETTCNYNHLDISNYKGKYILIESLNALHAGVKASQGSFSLPFDGWIVESGKRSSIDAATVAGGIKEVLLNIIQVEDSQITTHQGVCPHVWVDNLSITGEA